jgi:hypothetical protein
MPQVPMLTPASFIARTSAAESGVSKAMKVLKILN